MKYEKIQSRNNLIDNVFNVCNESKYAFIGQFRSQLTYWQENNLTKIYVKG